MKRLWDRGICGIGYEIGRKPVGPAGEDRVERRVERDKWERRYRAIPCMTIGHYERASIIRMLFIRKTKEKAVGKPWQSCR